MIWRYARVKAFLYEHFTIPSSFRAILFLFKVYGQRFQCH